MKSFAPLEKAAKITLSLDRTKLRNDWDDAATITASVTDANGVIVPAADAAIAFQLNGPAAIAAVDSANNTSHEPFQANTRRVFDGWCIAIIRATAAGKITIGASAPGLTPASVTIEAAAQ